MNHPVIAWKKFLMKTCTVVKIAFPSLSQVFLFKCFQDITRYKYILQECESGWKKFGESCFKKLESNNKIGYAQVKRFKTHLSLLHNCDSDFLSGLMCWYWWECFLPRVSWRNEMGRKFPCWWRNSIYWIQGLWRNYETYHQHGLFWSDWRQTRNT